MKPLPDSPGARAVRRSLDDAVAQDIARALIRARVRRQQRRAPRVLTRA